MSTILFASSPQTREATRSEPVRNLSVDLLKFGLALVVVALHVGLTAGFSPAVGYLTTNGLFRIAVPIFFIINGYYFYPVLQRGEMRRWFVRATGLYLFWTAVYGYYWLAPLGFTVSGFAKAIHTLLVGYFHLWYLCGMIGAAGVMLLLRKTPTRIAIAIAALMYALGVLVQYAGNYHVFSHPVLDLVCNRYWGHRNFLFLSFPFFYIGYVINEYRLHERVTVAQACCGVVVGAALLLLESYFNFRHPQNDGGFDNFATLVLICPAIFLVACNVKIYGAHRNLALYSSGLFLVHILVLYLLKPYAHIGTIAMTFLVLFVSLGVITALIPLSRKVRFIL